MSRRPQTCIRRAVATAVAAGLASGAAAAWRGEAHAAGLPAGGARAPRADWSAASWRWRRVTLDASGQGQGVLAVAAESGAAGRIAVGDLEGVSIARAGQRFRFAARVAGVTDLAFAKDGALWIASASGLWRLSPDGALGDRSPAPGEMARRVRRLLVTDTLVVAATDAGAWASRHGRTWIRMADGLPSAPVVAVAPVRGSAPDAPGLWLLVGRELWRATLVVRGPTVSLAGAQRVPVPGAPTSELPVDLATALPGAEVVVLYPRALAVRPRPGEAFRLLRPVLPPAALATRIRAGAERVWLATDQGLLNAPGWAGPWRRCASPAGSEPVRSLALAQGGDALLLAGPSGLLRGAPVLLAARGDAAPADAPTPTDAPGLRPRLSSDPDIRAVQAASLRYLDLEPERMRALRAGLDRRGWLPALSLRLGAARDQRRGWDYDQSFLSGDTRHLYDRDREKALDLEASLVVTWDLGQLAFDDDAIDISREHRLIVSLRDNVLDEINQLYFERRGLLAQLREEPQDAADREGLVRRAAELAAGLDAWTGGWFSSQRPDSFPHPSRGHGPEEQP